jgi:hypothetical protein
LQWISFLLHILISWRNIDFRDAHVLLFLAISPNQHSDLCILYNKEFRVFRSFNTLRETELQDSAMGCKCSSDLGYERCMQGVVGAQFWKQPHLEENGINLSWMFGK